MQKLKYKLFEPFKLEKKNGSRSLELFSLQKIEFKFFELEEVIHIQNFTDVDDKLIDRSAKENESVEVISERYIQEYIESLRTLNIKPAANYPRATMEIPSMIEFIEVLISKEFAYEVNGDVYFRVTKDPDYGKLSRRNLDSMRSSVGVEGLEKKEHPMDFSLWKTAKPGEPSWQSPWGLGRPGWHIECSAMAFNYLGKTIDIHGGGQDLVFPHHENEIAQSCCANKTKNFANYWLHNGFVTFDKEKMSKSIGNIVTINKLRENINGQVVRLALLSSHYKQPLDWNEKLIQESQNTLDKWYGQFEKINSKELNEDLLKPLQEDLNTPEYIAQLHSLFDESSRGNKSSKIKFISACNQIGLLEEDKQSWENFKKSKVKVDENFINQKIQDRNNARKKGDYKLADTIRKELEDSGVAIEDKQEKTLWKYK